MKEIKNILAIRTDRFGEFILTLPAIYALKETFPSSRISLMAHPYSAQLIQRDAVIDEIIEYEDSRFEGIIPTFRLIRKIRKRKYDLAVAFNPKKKFNMIIFFAGIPIRVGYARKCGFLLTHKLDDKKHLGQKHEIEYNLELIGLIGAKASERSLVVKTDGALTERLLRRLNLGDKDKLIAVHPWTSDVFKQWPVKNFIHLSERLLDEYASYKIALIGGAQEVDRSKVFYKENSRLLNLTGKLSLLELAGFFKKCKCLVSNDSGPVHLASSVGLPVVAIFRNDVPGKSSKRWGPWGNGHILIEKGNLANISVDEVLEKVRIILNKTDGEEKS